VLGGVLWAVTPLRQPVFDAGRTAEEGETFFRSYNGVLVVVAALLTVALLHLRDSARTAGKAAAVGWWIVLVGHVLLAVGSVPALLLGDGAPDLVTGGQDLGFLGAMVAALGALVLGVALRRHAVESSLAAWLLLLTLPLGIILTVTLDALGVPEDYLGLPLTVLYGGAWVVLGLRWLRSTL
jgi:hypothetical protein